MKALWHHELHVVIDTNDCFIELQPLGSDEHIQVSLADRTLVIDPTDGDLHEAEAARNYRSHCCECPHDSYHTVSVTLGLHLCHSCGEAFKDSHRTKRYVHFKGSHLT